MSTPSTPQGPGSWSGQPGGPTPPPYPGPQQGAWPPPDSGHPQPAPPVAPAAPVTTQQPSSVRTAVRLMYAGAVLSVLGGLAALLSRDRMRQELQEALTETGERMTPSELDAAVTAGVVTAAVMGVLFSLVWVLMARLNASGKSWARVVATVLAGLSVLGLLASLSGAAGTAAGPLSILLSVLQTLVGVAAAVLLWRPDASAFFRGRSTVG